MTLPPQLQCPSCQGNLEIVFARNAGRARWSAGMQETDRWWRIIHPAGPDCLFRWETFGHAETEEEAWTQARDAVENFSKQSTQ